MRRRGGWQEAGAEAKKRRLEGLVDAYMEHGIALLHEARCEQGESEVDAPDEGGGMGDEGAKAQPCAEEGVVGVGLATGGGSVDEEDGADAGNEGAER